MSQMGPYVDVVYLHLETYHLFIPTLEIFISFYTPIIPNLLIYSTKLKLVGLVEWIESSPSTFFF